MGAYPKTIEWAPPNVMAFSCEAANAMIECFQNAARLRLLQRLVSQQKWRTHYAPHN